MLRKGIQYGGSSSSTDSRNASGDWKGKGKGVAQNGFNTQYGGSSSSTNPRFDRKGKGEGKTQLATNTQFGGSSSSTDTQTAHATSCDLKGKGGGRKPCQV